MPLRSGVRRVLFGQYISPQASQFLARTSGLDNAHRKAYIALINGLVVDGVWPLLDLLQIYAAPDQTTANLNLVSSSFTASATGSPTWTVDRGYTTASNKWVDCNWMPTNGVNFQQDAASIFCWIGSTASAFQPTIGLKAASNGGTKLQCRTSGDTCNAQINDGAAVTSPANADASGFWVAIRKDSNTKAIYKNGTQLGGDITRVSTSPTAATLQTSGDNTNSGNASGHVHRAIGAGGLLTPTDISNFFTRISVFMAAIGATP